MTDKPLEAGYYAAKTTENKWGIAYWDGKKWWDDTNQDGKLKMGIRNDFIVQWSPLDYNINTELLQTLKEMIRHAERFYIYASMPPEDKSGYFSKAKSLLAKIESAT